MKRFLALLLVAVMSLSLFSCSSHIKISFIGEEDDIAAARKDDVLTDAAFDAAYYIQDLGYEIYDIAINTEASAVIIYLEGIELEDMVLDELNLCLDAKEAHTGASALFDSFGTDYELWLVVTVKHPANGWGWDLITDTQDTLDIHYGMRTDQLPIIVEK